MIKHPAITYMYQFLAEAIIVFMILMPFTFNYYTMNHYAGYVMAIVVIGGYFFIGELLRLGAVYQLISLPIGVSFLYMFKFPIGLIIVFPIFFLWRYMTIRTYKRYDHSGLYLHVLYTRYERNLDKIYLHMTIILAIIGFVITQERVIFFLTFLQIIILLSGFWLSHIRAITKEDREQLNTGIFTAIPISLLVIGFISFYYYQSLHNFFTNVWNTIGVVFASLGGFVAQIINFIIPTLWEYEMSDAEQQEWLSSIEEARQNTLSYISTDETDYTMLIVTIAIVLLGILGLLIFRAFRKGQYERIMKSDENVSYHNEDMHIPERAGFLTRVINRMFRRPANPVRELVYDFERQANEANFGRRPYESIEDWFYRLDIEVNIKTYQKVRYGDQDVSEDEISRLKQELEAIAERFAH